VSSAHEYSGHWILEVDGYPVCASVRGRVRMTWEASGFTVWNLDQAILEGDTPGAWLSFKAVNGSVLFSGPIGAATGVSLGPGRVDVFQNDDEASG
jgi:hypothetical protein